MFLYFIPTDRPNLTAKEIKAAGLGYLGIKHNPPGRSPVAGGPGGKPGILFVADGKSAAAYKPAEQTWLAGPGGKYFVGRATADEPIGPEDLDRKRFIDGEPIELPDGNTWTIPVCRSIVRGSSLPEALCLGPDGETWTFKELPEFVGLCQSAEEVWKQWFAKSEEAASGKPGDFQLTWSSSAAIAAEALGVNYRIGPIECSALGLFTTESVGKILMAIIDVPELARVAAAKKNTLAISPTAAGETASSPATSPPSPT